MPPRSLALLVPLLGLGALMLRGGARASTSGSPCDEPAVLVIGDVHGCLAELRRLLQQAAPRPGCDRVIFVGDLIGKGPDSASVLRAVRDLNQTHAVESVLGNWEAGLLDAAPPLASSRAAALGLGPPDLAWLRARPLYVRLPPEFGGALVVHAGMEPGVPIGAQRRLTMLKMRSLDAEGAPSKLPGRAGWAVSWKGPEHIIFGHDARRGLQREAFATGLDSGATYGHELSALWVRRRLVANATIGPTRLLQVSALNGSCKRPSVRGEAS